MIDTPAAAPGPGGALDVMALTSSPERFFARRLEERGDPFRVRFPGLGDVLVTGHPDGARDIFGAPADAFVPTENNPVEPLLGAGSLILLGGDRHRRERKIMMPPFHGDRMRAYGRIIQSRTLEEIARWPAAGDARLDVQAMTRAITLDVILRAIFGVRDEATRARFHETIVAMLDGYTTPLVALPALRRGFGGIGPWARFAKARDAFRALLHAEIAARRAEAQHESRASEREDVLSLLVAARYEDGEALSDEHLSDELCTLLVAGHETSATALAWALFYLGRDATLTGELRAEIAGAGAAPSPDALAELPLLGAVCNEALRLHPVVPIAIRRAARDVTVRGVAVPEGASVAVALTLLHHHASVWSEPSRFWPQRFLTRKYTPFEMAPFGGGARRCVGAAFATYEMKVILGTLIAHARLEGADTPPPKPVVKNITMAPSKPIYLHAVANPLVASHPTMGD